MIMKEETESAKKTFYAALVGTIVVAVCCFTPILVILFVGVGLSAFTHYLDYVLFPALALLIILTIVSYGKWGRMSGKK
jgi:mercuric ion transport protein